MKRSIGVLITACVVAACGGDNMGLMKQDVKAGAGAEATSGRRVQVHYTGWLYDEGKADHKGKQFDSSRGGEGFSFRLGAGDVIPGCAPGIDSYTLCLHDALTHSPGRPVPGGR